MKHLFNCLIRANYNLLRSYNFNEYMKFHKFGIVFIYLVSERISRQRHYEAIKYLLNQLFICGEQINKTDISTFIINFKNIFIYIKFKYNLLYLFIL